MGVGQLRRVRNVKVKRIIADPIVCNDLNDLLTRVEGKVNNGWMFRGQEKGYWPLASKFERACDRFNISYTDRQRIEDNMVREFRRRLYQYTTHVPSIESYLEILALMQHHGAPTRLLDFTYSPHVAAYFAFESAKHIPSRKRDKGTFFQKGLHRH
jgi:hypothetical protein